MFNYPVDWVFFHLTEKHETEEWKKKMVESLWRRPSKLLEHTTYLLCALQLYTVTSIVINMFNFLKHVFLIFHFSCMFGLDHAEWEVQSLSSYHTLSFFKHRRRTWCCFGSPIFFIHVWKHDGRRVGIFTNAIYCTLYCTVKKKKKRYRYFIEQISGGIFHIN